MTSAPDGSRVLKGKAIMITKLHGSPVWRPHWARDGAVKHVACKLANHLSSRCQPDVVTREVTAPLGGGVRAVAEGKQIIIKRKGEDNGQAGTPHWGRAAPPRWP